jgi:hypothetical protein
MLGANGISCVDMHPFKINAPNSAKANCPRLITLPHTLKPPKLSIRQLYLERKRIASLGGIQFGIELQTAS